jgi:AcrR family transcriptional regulator
MASAARPRSAAKTRPAKTKAPVNGERPRDAEVLRVAAEVFARRGYAAATVQDIADALGILKGSIYYYIDTKEDLLYRLILQVHEDVDAVLEDVRASDGQDPLDAIADYVRAQTSFNLRDLVRISVYYRDIDQLGDARRREVLARRKLHEQYVQSLIEAAQEAGTVRKDRDPHLLANHVFATLIWPYQWYRPRSRTKLDDVVESCVEFVLAGLRG